MWRAQVQVLLGCLVPMLGVVAGAPRPRPLLPLCMFLSLLSVKGVGSAGFACARAERAVEAPRPQSAFACDLPFMDGVSLCRCSQMLPRLGCLVPSRSVGGGAPSSACSCFAL